MHFHLSWIIITISIIFMLRAILPLRWSSRLYYKHCLRKNMRYSLTAILYLWKDKLNLREDKLGLLAFKMLVVCLINTDNGGHSCIANNVGVELNFGGWLNNYVSPNFILPTFNISVKTLSACTHWSIFYVILNILCPLLSFKIDKGVNWPCLQRFHH